MIAHLWLMQEWGNPNELQYYEYMKSYSPVDNVKSQVGSTSGGTRAFLPTNKVVVHACAVENQPHGWAIALNGWGRHLENR